MTEPVTTPSIAPDQIASLPVTGDGGRMALALVLAAGLHAGVLGWLAWPASDLRGSGGTILGAVSVSVVDSAVLEAFEARDAMAAAASQAASDRDGRVLAVAPDEDPRAVAAAPVVDAGPPDAASADAPSEHPPSLEPVIERADRVLEARAAPTLPDIVLPPPMDDQAVELAPPPPPPRPEAAVTAPPIESTRPPPPSGGTTASAVQGDAAAPSGVAGASPGTVQRHASAVFERLGRQIKRAVDKGDTWRGGERRATGTVRLTFTLAPSGRVADAQVKLSSGNGQLDAAALDAIRRIDFPRAPADMTSMQLFYEVPVHFR